MLCSKAARVVEVRAGQVSDGEDRAAEVRTGEVRAAEIDDPAIVRGMPTPNDGDCGL